MNHVFPLSSLDFSFFTGAALAPAAGVALVAAAGADVAAGCATFYPVLIDHAWPLTFANSASASACPDHPMTYISLVNMNSEKASTTALYDFHQAVSASFFSFKILFP